MDEYMETGQNPTPMGGALTITAAYKNASVTERLEREKRVLTERLALVDSLLEQLKKQPDVQQILDRLAELGVR